MTQITPDYIETGSGPTVILVHSSVAGARQWRALMDAMSDQAHLIAINLFGYGKTPAWTQGTPQTLEDQARLIAPFLPTDGTPVSIVGHSFGGSVAMKAASLYAAQIRRLVLIEPNPFYLLKLHGRASGYQEALHLQSTILRCGASDNWREAAEVFANYWTGHGSWAAMPQDRQDKFAQALKPNFHEWNAVMTEETSLEHWVDHLPRDTSVILSKDTVQSIHDITALLQEAAPHWNFETVEQGGHMAALSKPDLVNPIIRRALA